MNAPYKILAVVDESAHDTGVEHVVETTAAEHAAATTDEHSETTAETTAHTAESTTHEEEPQGIAALGLDPIAIGAQALTFLVLFWIVKKYALTGVVANLEKRRKDISRGLHLTAQMDKEKAALDERVEAALRSARKDADAIVAEANAESGRIIKAAEDAANNKAEEILRAAEGRIEREIADARRGLKAEMASLITEATGAILNTKLDESADRKLAEDYLSEALK